MFSPASPPAPGRLSKNGLSSGLGAVVVEAQHDAGEVGVVRRRRRRRCSGAGPRRFWSPLTAYSLPSVPNTSGPGVVVAADAARRVGLEGVAPELHQVAIERQLRRRPRRTGRRDCPAPAARSPRRCPVRGGRSSPSPSPLAVQYRYTKPLLAKSGWTAMPSRPRSSKKLTARSRTGLAGLAAR